MSLSKVNLVIIMQGKTSIYSSIGFLLKMKWLPWAGRIKRFSSVGRIYLTAQLPSSNGFANIRDNQTYHGFLNRLIEQNRNRLDWFMKFLNKTLARQANKENRCTGRFWENQYRLSSISDRFFWVKKPSSLVVYVDLNSIRLTHLKRQITPALKSVLPPVLI